MGRVQPSPCFQCRFRKVRCDRRPGRCTNCERLDFSCSFQRDQAGPTTYLPDLRETVADRPERRRGSQACIECRRQKARCSGEFPELVSPIAHDEMLRHIDDFFTYLYPIPCYAFLHEPSIRQRCVNGTLDTNLALSIAAVSALCLSRSPSQSPASTTKITEVETFLWQNLEAPNITQLQTLLLVVHYHIQASHFSRAYMLAGLAARSATALRLNYERPELGFIAQETRRRVLWALSFIDGYFSVGLPEYETIPHTIVYQRLPCSEDAFRNGGPADTDTSAGYLPSLDADNSSTEGCSLLGACTRISKISKDIMRLTRQLALAEQPLAQLSGLVQEIQHDLWRVQADVVHTFAYNVASSARVTAKSTSRWFVRFLQVSMTWHQAHCDLYRLFLPEYPEAAPRVIMETIAPRLRLHALDACVEHVAHIHQVLRALQDLSFEPVLPSQIAVCAYHATRLTLFLPLSPDFGEQLNLDMDGAIECARTALEFLERFYLSSAPVQMIINDMRQLVKLSRGEPAVIYRELCGSEQVFDQGRHRHSHLAIHSLVRQANFVDDGYE
ncbi:uncharacterized protein N7482_003422 [Penicillium canariense]|uniref:Zn(2)-C6 fungal-type domain-containing protein n=1 Tax=Penicillium canariense TaxID=189055 RepID=A0A9W9LPK5_9EURO|nr:uncharacterized protein N7482_003422 [Penicillium canariense]KAJ5167828.1 hypothetical protein N7482_003422 [Penicillium canariense]